MSLVMSYLQEWERMFSPTEDAGDELSTSPTWSDRLALSGIRGELRNCRFRSVCWKVFLGVLPKHRDEWLQATNDSRLDYEMKRRQVLEFSSAQNSKFNSNEGDVVVGNSASPWNRTMDDDQELRQTIDQDVVRTHPRVQFFNLPQIQHLMSDVLFVFARLNPHLQYRQGMHELLAPLVFVLRADHQAFEHVQGESEFAAEQFNSEVSTLVDGTYFEHDAYAMFCKVMRVVEPWYTSAQLMTAPRPPSASETPSPPPVEAVAPIEEKQQQQQQQQHVSFEAGTAAAPESHVRQRPTRKQSTPNAAEREILARLQHIHSGLLKEIDPPLYQHLERLDVAPQLYGIRWVRLLFGREFTIQDLLVLWDALFAHDSELVLVDYVFVAMLIYVRDLLLHGDFSACLHVVMRYPPVADVGYLVQSALYLSDPARFPRPPPSHPLPVTLQNNMVVGTKGSSPTMNSPLYNMSPSSSFAGDIIDQAGNFLSRGFNSIQRRIEDVAGVDQSPQQQAKAFDGDRARTGSNSSIPPSSSSSSIRLSRFIPDAIISGAKAPSASAAKFVDKFLSVTISQPGSNGASPNQSPVAPNTRRQQPPPKRPEPPKTLPQTSHPSASQKSSLNADQTVLLNVCSRALSDLDAALSDLNLLRPVLTDPRHAQVAADIAQRVTAARNSLQVISGRPLVASSSSSSSRSSGRSTPSSVAASP